jgi:ABC-type multidrug transport system fused ATPase/permease subunit
MQTTRPSIGKYICGMAASLIIFLAGGWLILAPFALGYQPYGADWISQTTNSFVIGICITVVALVAFVLFFMSLLGSLRATGVLTATTRPVAQAPAPDQVQATIPQAPVQNQSDLDKTLATLAAALAADLNSRRQTGSDQQSDQNRSIVNRSEGQ